MEEINSDSALQMSKMAAREAQSLLDLDLGLLKQALAKCDLSRTWGEIYDRTREVEARGERRDHLRADAEAFDAGYQSGKREFGGQALLGLATTRDLLQELETRGRVPESHFNPEMADKLQSWVTLLLQELDEPILEYRTAPVKTGETDNPDSGLQ